MVLATRFSEPAQPADAASLPSAGPPLLPAPLCGAVCQRKLEGPARAVGTSSIGLLPAFPGVTGGSSSKALGAGLGHGRQVAGSSRRHR
jgi:hypothetical protein